MSAFQPLDIQGPIDRRKALLNKLMQQYQTSAQAAAHLPLPGAVHSMPSPEGGRPFHTYADMPNLPHSIQTQGDNVAPGLAAQLGPGGYGHPLPIEMPAGPGAPIPVPRPDPAQAITQPTPPTPIGTGGPPPLPSLPVTTPVSTPAPSSAPAPAPAAPVAPVGSQAPQAPTPTQAPTPVQGISGGANGVGASQYIPLGNGLFYDPINDAIRGGAVAPSAGQAARSVGVPTGRTAA